MTSFRYTAASPVRLLHLLGGLLATGVLALLLPSTALAAESPLAGPGVIPATAHGHCHGPHRASSDGVVLVVPRAVARMLRANAPRTPPLPTGTAAPAPGDGERRAETDGAGSPHRCLPGQCGCDSDGQCSDGGQRLILSATLGLVPRVTGQVPEVTPLPAVLPRRSFRFDRPPRLSLG